MKVKDLISTDKFKMLNDGSGIDREITTPYCCDLLSVAMGRMPSGAAWVTVMANINTLAVAKLADAACIVLAEGSQPDEAFYDKAREQEITVMLTDMPVFDSAMFVYNKLNA